MTGTRFNTDRGEYQHNPMRVLEHLYETTKPHNGAQEKKKTEIPQTLIEMVVRHKLTRLRRQMNWERVATVRRTPTYPPCERWHSAESTKDQRRRDVGTKNAKQDST